MGSFGTEKDQSFFFQLGFQFSDFSVVLLDSLSLSLLSLGELVDFSALFLVG